MSVFNLKTAALAIVAGVGLSGCAYGPYGSGLGVGVGYGNGYGYGDYYDPYYGGYYGANYNRYGSYGYGYGMPYYGWYNGYYYPGAGYWVYDRDRERRALTPEERAYWLERIRRYRAARGAGGATAVPTGQEARENWSGFSRPTAGTVASGADTATRRDALRQRVIEQRAERAQATAEQRQARSERMEARRQEIQERSEARRERRRPQE